MDEINLLKLVSEQLDIAETELNSEYPGTIDYGKIGEFDEQARIDYFGEMKYYLLALELAKAALSGRQADPKYLLQWNYMRKSK